MADGVTFQTSALASPASGEKIATDDCGAAGQVQIIKIAISADGSATLIPADATNGIDVDVTRIAFVASTPSFTISAASTNATSLKASAGVVYAIQAFNINAAIRYLKLYNKASAPTVGSDTPVKVLAIPPGSGFVLSFGPSGVSFTTGIAWALTTGITNADTGAVAASEILVNIDYI